ncbi:drug/metabolite transporter (DMT)-like permease [Duganella sp. SG902]|uniref:DMT family transporter n=1 Tax=Duganella sp. SG902 TaxID=2587016 RepID=UPI00159E9860|nr:DMT family transporter [Duganella sp. SG902]NVM75505.1 drug/metabolite transporter (DMT)-like permease [Duganella sp. SG902]
MKKTDLACLLLLAALWGASYLFMRIGAGEFGALAMAGARAALASLLLVPILILRRDGGLAALRRNWKRIALVGMTNCTLPFLLFSYAALSINASLSAIFNAATPMYAAIIGWLWIRERIAPARAASMALGFAGVAWLAWDGAGFKDGATDGRCWRVSHLIARVGASRTMAVPFLVPAFGVLWGVLFLGEVFSVKMALGSVLIVIGTAGAIRFAGDGQKTPASAYWRWGRLWR